METYASRCRDAVGVHTPHSLGKLIEWKLKAKEDIGDPKKELAPHSLGKLIEWKPA